MSTTTAIHPLSRERHKGMGWQRFTHYGFARPVALASLAAPEVTKAALHLPLAFYPENGAWKLGAVLGLEPGQNLFVAPDGRWLGGYTPATLRSYPFRIGRPAGTEEAVLCIDEASGLLVEGGGEPFFTDGGEIGASLAGIWSFLLEVAKGEAQLSAASALIAEAGLIEPWPIALKDGEATRNVEGLHRIGEEKLGALDDAAFSRLRRSGVLALVYAQMLSTGHFTKLGELAEAHARAARDEAERRRSAEVAAATAPAEPAFGGGFAFGQSLDVDWSKIG
ncbi:hypothetical protein ASG43_20820 [Aureimonas sp. Leaf454]|uniref:SapC family protein n=1 Tax=Aureimonas sp. Leaf454 TaxID=1736381 RepID=UPI0006F5A7F1|nr:SapC family protein [Aureimonas sp. Leaf454]KQT51936.1 hypothetical protein ASG43_20820 [Aureimonas sp. Leaf454]